MKKPLKDELKTHFEKQCLSQKQIQELRQSLRDQSISEPKKQSFPIVMSLALMACIALVVVSFMKLSGSQVEKIAHEVAYNHNKQLEPEILTAQLSEAQEKLNRLEFTMIESQHLPARDWELIGARYCSIGGHIAAQLKVKNKKNGETYTLYQVPLQKDWDPQKLNSAVIEDSGVVVKMWVEKGLLLATAGKD